MLSGSPDSETSQVGFQFPSARRGPISNTPPGRVNPSGYIRQSGFIAWRVRLVRRARNRGCVSRQIGWIIFKVLALQNICRPPIYSLLAAAPRATKPCANSATKRCLRTSRNRATFMSLSGPRAHPNSVAMGNLGGGTNEGCGAVQVPLRPYAGSHKGGQSSVEGASKEALPRCRVIS